MSRIESPPPNRLFDEIFLRKLERLAIFSRRAMSGQQQGERRSIKRGQSVEFADFRPYTPGDDLRRIDWNAYARLDRFFIKLFVEEEDLTVHLLLDTSGSMTWGEPAKLPYAIQIAGALGYIALTGLDRVTVTALGANAGSNGSIFGPSRGRLQAPKLFAFLQALSGTGQVDLAAELQNYAAAALQTGPLLLITDLMEETWQDGMGVLAARGFEITLLHILSPQEIEPSFQGDVKLLDVETGATVEITADYDLLQRYRENLRIWQGEIAQFCSTRGIHYIPVDTATSFEELLFSVMRQRGVVL
ncbi:DUF58 domain-containing protein [Chloroflexi bacterium TSY]|nr:DUF58 domain-containing protein [Chloroflexi bacterium TSY]